MNRPLLTLAILLVCTASCQRDTPSPLDDILQASKQSVTLSFNASSYDTIHITSNTDWSVLIPQELDWLKIEPMSGSGNGILVFSSIQDNDSITRSGKIEIKTIAGGKTISIGVAQTGQSGLPPGFTFGMDGDDFFTDFVETDEGDFIALGQISNAADGLRPRVVKFDKEGNVLWEKMLHDGWVAGIAKSTTGVFVALCTTFGHHADVDTGGPSDLDVWLTAMDTNGNILWDRKIGGSQDEECYSIEATGDGHVILAGYTESKDHDVVSNTETSRGAWLVKMSSAGDILWEKTFFPGFGNRFAHATPLPDGAIIFGGEYLVEGETPQIVISKSWYGKLGGDAAVEWSSVRESSAFYITAVTSTGDYLFGGLTIEQEDLPNYHAGSDAMLICTDAAGDVKWKSAYGGSGSERFYALVESVTGNTIAAGPTKSSDGDFLESVGGQDAFVMEIGAEGKLITSRTYGTAGDDAAGSLVKTHDNRVAFVGSRFGMTVTRSFDSWFAFTEL